MLKKFLKRCYRCIPGIRELLRLEGVLWQIRNALHLESAIESSRFFDIELRQHPRFGDPKRLTKFEFQVTSQNGEDGIIHEIFRRIGFTSRFFVEVGVSHSSECNTAFLVSQGWHGVWIDGDDRMAATVDDWVRANGPGLTAVCACVTEENIAALFARANVPAEFDLLSLDIDQNTYYAWRGLKEFRPRAVVIEYNSAIPPDIDWKVRYDPERVFDQSNNYGASLKALENLGRELNYSLVGCDFTGANAFFVRSDLTAGHFAPPFSSENHYEPPRLDLHLLRRAHRKSLLDRNTIPKTNA